SAGGKAVTAPGLARGYARLAAGRTTVIADAAPPPGGADSLNAHASTLAIEVTSGRRPLIVNCGSGAPFGEDWHRAGRATPSHSTLCIRGVSSSRLGRPRLRRWDPRELLLLDAPDQVWAQSDADLDAIRLLIGHNGYAGTHGLTHVRQLALSNDGRSLSGEDTLGVMTALDRKVFAQLLAKTQQPGIRFDIRFHLHPDADAALDLGGTAVSVALRSGELWVFRHDGVAALSLEPSVYLQAGRADPRPTRQIVLSAMVSDYACQIGWTLAKAQDTPAAIRDTAEDEPADADAS
ncbi:MAG: heparinase II/III family protein, partial [Paracoccaceae bacterium]